MITRTTRRAAFAAFLAALLPLAACSSPVTRVAIDGDIRDWPKKASAVASPEFLSLRFENSTPGMPAHASNASHSIAIDLDGDPTTGFQFEGPADPIGKDKQPLGTLGVDLQITFSPPADLAGRDASDETGLAEGVAIVLFDNAGNPSNINAREAGLVASPPALGDWHELRLDRYAPAFASTPLAGESTARGVVLISSADGAILDWPASFSVDLPAVTLPAGGDEAIEQQPKNSLRVLSVHLGPEHDPAAIARIASAAKPDLIFMQGAAGSGSADEIAQGLQALVGTIEGKNEGTPELRPDADDYTAPGSWEVAYDATTGVVVASPFDPRSRGIELDLDDAIKAYPPGAEPSDTAAVAVIARHPDAMIYAASVAFTAGGTASADTLRDAEAESLNQLARERVFAAISGPATVRVIAGVMERTTEAGHIETLADRLDTGGSSLEIAIPRLLADEKKHPAPYSSTPAHRAAGVTDAVLYSGDTLKIIDCFSIDTARMSSEALTASGLTSRDTDGLEGLPIVADFKLK